VSGLDIQLKERPCNVYSSDMRVNVRATGLYTYPDVVVTCGEERFADDHHDTLLNPLLIIEVLSDSTEAYDRGTKFEHYQQIDSLVEYLLVSQHVQRVEQFFRQNMNQWLYTDTRDPEGMITLSSITCSLKLQEIYHKVEFQTPLTLH
jgi:Uma2 family endonuclease